jgi:hypothetical protein
MRDGKKWTGGPHNAVFVVWGISDFDSITLTNSSNTGLGWATRPSWALLNPRVLTDERG